MIALPAGAKVWLAAGATDMRKGFDGLAALIQMELAEDPFSGQLFVFRGRAGDRVKILWWDGDGLCLFAKRLERGRFVWPQATHGAVALTAAVVDAARRHRLASSGAHQRTAAGSVSAMACFAACACGVVLGLLVYLARAARTVVA
jgi:transposase